MPHHRHVLTRVHGARIHGEFELLVSLGIESKKSQQILVQVTALLCCGSRQTLITMSQWSGSATPLIWILVMYACVLVFVQVNLLLKVLQVFFPLFRLPLLVFIREQLVVLDA